MSSRNTYRRALTGAALGIVLAVGVPLAASAHVTVNPGTADPGSYTQVQFRVPNESETAETVRLEVTLPSDTPFTSVRYEPVPGWTATITTATLPQPVEVGGNTITEAPTSIVWQADPGVGIGQGEFVNFPVSLGPVPDVGSVLLPAVQTYDDGKVAEWTATPTRSPRTTPSIPRPCSTSPTSRRRMSTLRTARVPPGRRGRRTR